MARPSERDLIEPNVRDYCNRAVKSTAEEMPLSFLGMSQRLQVNRATLKKYFSTLIKTAQQKQQGNDKTGEVKRRPLECAEKLRNRDQEIFALTQRNKGLLALNALVELNAARLGINPEELYVPVPKPDRRVSRAGRAGRFTKRGFVN
jgi:hypothetical protein